MKPFLRLLILATLVAGAGAPAALRAQQGTLSAADKTRRLDTENELQSLAIVERKVMLPMPDGVRLATDIYRPKNAGAKVPDRSGCGRRTTSTSGTCTTACRPT